MRNASHGVRLRKMIVYAMLGTILFLGKLIMEGLPNIHPIAMFITAFTLVYRTEALIPIYIYVFLTGLYGGFNLWWVPYLYIWTILWLVIMLLPKHLPNRAAFVLYAVVCMLFGLAYGTLYAPAQAILFGYDFATTIKWIISGLPFDVMHGIGNLVMSILVLPLAKLLRQLNRQIGIPSSQPVPNRVKP
ncbi:MAG: hypothetical protein IJ325_01355 [Clostridia bacterium]|nr:hypothetical protein [Clostridia bacterium]